MTLHRSPAVGAALFLLARDHLPWSGWPRNERQIFAAAGVSMEEAAAAKAELLDRLYDFLYFEADEDAGKIANMAEIISEMMDPNFPYLLGRGPLVQRQALTLAALTLTDNMTLSLDEISRLSGISLDLLENAYLVIRPDLAAQAPKQPPQKKKKRATAKSKKK
jgi:hypothetical protein